jgi:hypothetical protein
MTLPQMFFCFVVTLALGLSSYALAAGSEVSRTKN